MIQGIDLFCQLRGKPYWTTMDVCVACECPHMGICGEFIRLNRVVGITTIIPAPPEKAKGVDDKLARIREFDDMPEEEWQEAVPLYDMEGFLIEEEEMFVEVEAKVKPKAKLSVATSGGKKSKRQLKKEAKAAKKKAKAEARPVHSPDSRGKDIGGRDEAIYGAK